ncbi:MAG: DNA polymerase III subunit delta [Caulobacteraceae bacterium]
MILSKRPDVDRFLAAPSATVRAAVIWGRDRGGVRERADILAHKVVPNPDDPFDVSFLTDGDIDAGRLEEALSSLSLTGGRRLVWLRLGGDRPAAEKASADALKIHVDGGFNAEAFFLVEAGALERSSALRKAAEAAAGAVSIPIYEDEVGDVARLVREALQQNGVGLTPDALEMFVARLPKERGVARQEIERLALFLGPGSGVTASIADLADHLGVEPDASLGEAAIDAFGGRTGAAQASLRRLRAEGEGGPAAVRALGMHLGKLRRALAAVHSGTGPAEAAKGVGVFWKNEREFLRQLRAWAPAELDRVQRALLDADRACKSAGSPDALIVERLVLSVAGQARRLGL